jgi:hypothetical protein
MMALDCQDQMLMRQPTIGFKSAEGNQLGHLSSHATMVL